MMPSVFISYSHSNAAEVEKVTALFDLHKIRYWIDYKNIGLGKKYPGEIVRGIEECEVFLFVYSKSSNTSEDQINEMGIAFRARKLIVPFILDDSEWNHDLRYMAENSQGIEVWRTGMDFALKALLGGIMNEQSVVRRDLPTTQPTPPETSDADEVDLDFEDAEDFMRDGDWQDALHALQASFENGNYKSIQLFNELLFRDFGMTDWDVETWDFMERLAQVNYSFAHLAYFYRQQHNKEMHSEANRHLKAALKDSNNGYAFLCEGIAREKGIGFRSNLKSAMKRYEQAYKMGVAEACSYIAQMYLNGFPGLEIDKKKAIEILTEGYEKDDARSCYVLGTIWAEADQEEGNFEKAINFFKKAIELQMYEGWIAMGKLYQDNIHMDNNRWDTAQHCYLEALKNGIKDGHAYIARLYWKQDRFEDARIEAERGERCGNVLSMSVLGEFYEQGMPDIDKWVIEHKPDYSLAWKYYQKAFQQGGRIEDAISMARLYVKEEFRPADVSWEKIESYLKEGAKVPILQAIELMVKALQDNGRAEDARKYLQIGAENGSLPMMHEYGVRMQSENLGEALKYIEEAGKNGYPDSVEWLMRYYCPSSKTSSKEDYEKWMDIAADINLEVPLKDYIPYLLGANGSEKVLSYLKKRYAGTNLESLYWMVTYCNALPVDKAWLLGELKNRYTSSNLKPLYWIVKSCDELPVDKMWLLGEMRQYYKELVALSARICDLYVEILLDCRDEQVPLFLPDDEYFAAYIGFIREAQKGPLSKDTLKSIKEISDSVTTPDIWRSRFRSLIVGTYSVSPRKVLVVDDVMSNVLLMKILLMREGYRVCTANSGAGCIEQARKEQPDLIVLDVLLPDISGFEVCAKLKEDVETRDIPIMFVTALNTPADLVRGFEVGGSDYMTKPFHKEEFLIRAGRLLSLSYFQRENISKTPPCPKDCKILLVDDVMSNVLLMKIALFKDGYQICTANSGTTCIEQAKKEQPDLILLDVMLPDISGFEVCAILKKDPETWNIPIMLVTALNTPADVVCGYKVGVSDFLTKPFNKVEFLMRIRNLLHINFGIKRLLE